MGAKREPQRRWHRKLAAAACALALATLALRLAAAEQKVALFLVDNGVFLAREGIGEATRQKLTDAGVSIHADEFALAQRGIDGDCASNVSSSPISLVVEHMAEGRKVIWH